MRKHGSSTLPVIGCDLGGVQALIDLEHTRNDHYSLRSGIDGFDLLNESAIMALSRADLDRVPHATALPIDERYYDQFRDLHPRLMPNTYFTAQQLLDRLDANSHLLIATHEGELLGYVYFQAGPVVSEGYVDFVAVAETARRRGLGAQLVAAAVHSAFSWPDIDVIRLTVNTSNSPAFQLYERLRFVPERTMMGFEK